MQSMRHRSFLIKFGIILPILFILTSCKETPPEPRNGTVNNGMLIVEDVGVTGAVLRLRIPVGFKSRSITLQRETTVILSKQITSHDTMVIDENLLPKHSYRYMLTVENLLKPEERYYANITTMDTTSHEFTWQIDTLGDYHFSSLRDLAIDNDTCVYVVGGIYKKDSMGNWLPFYNLARWNGIRWELIRVKVKLNYGTSIIITDQDELISIFMVNQSDIWMVSESGGVSRYLNGNWIMMDIPYGQGPGGANKIWGTSSKDLYFVGDDGKIIRYDGSRWQRIESGTALDVQDIVGVRDKRSGDYEILAVASKRHVSYDRVILKLNGTGVQHLSDDGINYSLRGIWFSPGRHYFAAGGGMYEKILLNQEQWKNIPDNVTNYYILAIRGNDVNDLICVGGFGEVLHFNGLSWRSYHNQTKLDYGNYISVSIKGDFVCAVDLSADGAHVLRGIRK